MSLNCKAIIVGFKYTHSSNIAIKRIYIGKGENNRKNLWVTPPKYYIESPIWNKLSSIGYISKQVNIANLKEVIRELKSELMSKVGKKGEKGNNLYRDRKYSKEVLNKKEPIKINIKGYYNSENELAARFISRLKSQIRNSFDFRLSYETGGRQLVIQIIDPLEEVPFASGKFLAFLVIWVEQKNLSVPYYLHSTVGITEKRNLDVDIEFVIGETCEIFYKKNWR